MKKTEEKTSRINLSAIRIKLPSELPCPVTASTSSDTANCPTKSAPLMNRKATNPEKNRERETDATDSSDCEADLGAEYNGGD